MRLFTKSAFKQALFCPASLYYYFDREHYANQMNEDDFLQALAEGGNQVGDLAKVYYDVHADADIRVLDYDKSQEITADLNRRGGLPLEELEHFDTARQMADESIANAGAALAAYTKLQFSDEVCTDALAKALLRYCELDTMSMVFIWEYFKEMTA